MKLVCGHEATRWVTVFYPDENAPYRRFCDVECMTWWHEQQRELQQRRFWQDEVPQLLAEMSPDERRAWEDKWYEQNRERMLREIDEAQRRIDERARLLMMEGCDCGACVARMKDDMEGRWT